MEETAMASITKRPDGRWRARYRDEAGKEHAKHFDRKVDAQRWVDEVTASIVTGQYVDPEQERLRSPNTPRLGRLPTSWGRPNDGLWTTLSACI